MSRYTFKVVNESVTVESGTIIVVSIVFMHEGREYLRRTFSQAHHLITMAEMINDLISRGFQVVS